MIVDVGMSFLTSTWVLTLIATVMLGMICVTTINMDKTSGWSRVSGVLPVSRKTVIDSKYLLYALLSGTGLLLGAALLLRDKMAACGAVFLLGIVLYSVSWYFAAKQIARREIV